MYRRKLRRFLRSNWLLLLVLAGLVGLVGTLQWVIMDGYWLGFVHGALIVGVVAGVLAVFGAHAGASWQLAGAWGEDNTRGELKKAARRHDVWGSVDGITLIDGDIDHLVVGPGGWFALDSKWHAKAMNRETIARDARCAARVAAKAQSVLISLHAPAPVRAVVVVWGAAGSTVPSGGALLHDVTFVRGGELAHWLGNHASQGLTDLKRSEETLRDLRAFKTRVRPGSRVHR